MKYTWFIGILLLVVISINGISGCAKLNEEDLVIDNQLCKVDTVSYSQHIQPYINSHCMPCHNSENQKGNQKLETWVDVAGAAVGGNLMGAMKHEPGYPKMPDNGPKSSNCVIQGFELWIAQGLLNN